ncbi:hypothetical protein M0R72_13160 [Candidatus Pacearchaeota archaeon]|jgi:predicted RecA/RadA family phage recombinase|nr:hypothetical protein [Candidatus Pacearchaeota archaeon]
MALSANAVIARKDGVMQSYPVADNVHIYKGALVCVDTSGYACPGADTAGYKFVGVAWEECDNTLTGHAAGGKSVLVDQGRFLLPATSITLPMVGSKMYLVDDATIDDIAGVTNKVEVGVLDEYVSATSGWVNTLKEGKTAGEVEGELPVELVGKARYGTIQAAMAAAVANDTLIVDPGTYQEDVTWSDYSGISLLPRVPGTVTVEAVTAFAISIDPAAASATWSATLGVALSHADGLKGLKVNNTNVGKRINIYLLEGEIEAETATDASIEVTRSGASSNAIRIYANAARKALIEGAVNIDLESADDRVRFDNYRLIGGIAVTGEIANAEITLQNCNILTGGRAFPAAATHNLIACVSETDANPNVYTAIPDEVAQTATS